MTQWLHEEEFLYTRASKSQATAKTYAHALRKFATWLCEEACDGFGPETAVPLNPATLTTTSLKAYEKWLSTQAGITESSAGTYLAAVTSYLDFLDARQRLPEGVSMGEFRAHLRERKHRTHDAASRHVMSQIDIRAQAIPQIVAYYSALLLPPLGRYGRRLGVLRARAFVNVLYSTAMRLSEIAQLNRKDVLNGRAGTVYIIGKGNKGRHVHLRAYAQDAIQTYLSARTDRHPALFVDHRSPTKVRRLSGRSLERIVETAVKKLNIPGNISAHDFRHYRATQLLQKGVPLDVVQEYLGHADPGTTRTIYAPALGREIIGKWLDEKDIPPEEAARLLEAKDLDSVSKQL